MSLHTPAPMASRDLPIANNKQSRLLSRHRLSHLDLTSYYHKSTKNENSPLIKMKGGGFGDVSLGHIQIEDRVYKVAFKQLRLSEARDVDKVSCLSLQFCTALSSSLERIS